MASVLPRPPLKDADVYSYLSQVSPPGVKNMSTGWQPLFPESYGLINIPDMFREIQHRVKDLNESWDILIAAPRGLGKSTVGLGVALLFNPNFSLDNWAFTMEDRLKLESELPPGSVLPHDEMGTRESGSSQEWMKSANKDFADQVQLNRTNRIIHIDITLDEGRILNRVRATYKILITPVRKLSNADTGGRGLATECIVRIVEMAPMAHGDPFFKKYWRYFKNGRIARYIVFHPPADLWKEYSKKRKEFQEQLDSIEEAQEARSRRSKKSPGYDAELRARAYKDF